MVCVRCVGSSLERLFYKLCTRCLPHDPLCSFIDDVFRIISQDGHCTRIGRSIWFWLQTIVCTFDKNKIFAARHPQPAAQHFKYFITSQTIWTAVVVGVDLLRRSVDSSRVLRVQQSLIAAGSSRKFLFREHIACVWTDLRSKHKWFLLHSCEGPWLRCSMDHTGQYQHRLVNDCRKQLLNALRSVAKSIKWFKFRQLLNFTVAENREHLDAVRWCLQMTCRKRCACAYQMSQS